MGRTLRRVPLDFNWPLNKTWEGFLNPYAKQQLDCECDGSGLSPQARVMREQWYGYESFDPLAYGATPLTVNHPSILAMSKWHVERSPEFHVTQFERLFRLDPDMQVEVQRIVFEELRQLRAGNKTFTQLVPSLQTAIIKIEAIRLHDLFKKQWSHHLIQADVDALLEGERLWDFTREARTPEQVEIVKAKVAAGGNNWLPEGNGYHPTAEEVNAWSIRGMGHDSINQSIVVKARCLREGVPHLCAKCEGEGHLWPNAEAKKQAEEWESMDPPTGEGFQLWETTSEGSAISPVFSTLEALCEWLEPNASTFGSQKTTASAWLKMLDADFVYHKEQRADGSTMVFL
jgi:hypothetical protein